MSGGQGPRARDTSHHLKRGKDVYAIEFNAGIIRLRGKKLKAVRLASVKIPARKSFNSVPSILTAKTGEPLIPDGSKSIGEIGENDNRPTIRGSFSKPHTAFGPIG